MRIESATDMAQALASAIVHDMPTPFDGQGALDEEAMAGLARVLGARGDMLLVNSEFGEVLSLAHDERRRAARIAIDAAGPAPVIVQVTAFSTDESCALATDAQRIGAAAVAVGVPYYWHLSQDELAAHLGAVAQSVALPIIVVSDSKPGTALDPAGVATLAQANANVAGVVHRGSGYIAPGEFGRRLRDLCRPFALLLEPPTAAALAYGGQVAFLSVLGPIAPALLAAVRDAARARDLAGVAPSVDRLIRLEQLFEGQPARLKHALAASGRSIGGPRSPLSFPDEAEQRVLDAALRRLGIPGGPVA